MLGANSGIGYDTVKALVSASTSYHIIMACRSAENAAKALSEIQATSPESSLSTVQLDVTDHASINQAAKIIDDEFGRLDILINNAGALPKSEGLVEQMRETFETNTIGQVVMTEAFRPLLAKSRDARLIFLSTRLSSISLRLQPDHQSYNAPFSAYRMSKAALNMWAACAAKEGREQGIRVWTVDPGLVATNLGGNKEALKQMGAGSSEVSAQTILSVIEGKRDADVGKLMYKDGVHPW
jgi:NAD(P)-dependent dehydrogenase (short-subunit alcohol dehydrogenase family)